MLLPPRLDRAWCVALAFVTTSYECARALPHPATAASSPRPEPDAASSAPAPVLSDADAIAAAPQVDASAAVVETYDTRERRLLAADPQCAEVMRGDSRAMTLLSPHTTIGRSALLTGNDAQHPARGDRFAVIGLQGYVGLLTADGSDATVVCYDDCPAFWAVARWTDGPRSRVVGDAVAVGPLNTTPVRARLHLAAPSVTGFVATSDPELERAFLEAPWVEVLRVDLDGDGHPDLERRVRGCGCAHVAIELRTRSSAGWRVSEREIGLSPQRCAPLPQAGRDL